MLVFLVRINHLKYIFQCTEYNNSVILLLISCLHIVNIMKQAHSVSPVAPPRVPEHLASKNSRGFLCPLSDTFTCKAQGLQTSFVS